LTNRKSKASSD